MDDLITNPQILVDGKPVEASYTPRQAGMTDLISSLKNVDLSAARERLPVIDHNDPREPGNLLRQYSIAKTNQNEFGFWSFALLNCILSRQRILNQLRKHTGICGYIDQIRPKEDVSSRSKEGSYLRIFALLLLLDRENEIGDFIRENVCDESLPLHCSGGTDDLKFTGWKTSEKEWFSTHQWTVLVPYFKLDSEGRPEDYNFPDKTILPWIPWEEGCSIDSNSEPAKDEGGYAEVAKIRIDPSSHGFQKVLKSICLNDDRFALKVLRDGPVNNEKQYLNEVEQLKRFSGLVHDHLVTVLATFTLKKRFHFLFPYAEYALDQYWRDKIPQPSLDLATVQWFSKQCLGLIEAMHTIHEPDHLNLPAGVKKYGRHGDIKPDNILWFHTTRDPNGIFVISDMGLSAFNSAKSRSNVPGHALPGAPGYRPPECEIEGGMVSRQFDVWTMGCLLLELVTWLLGGQQMLDEFQAKRMSVYINGSKNDIFFEIKTTRGEVPVVAQVKQSVTEWIAQLHAHKKCPKFVHDVLNIIENHMLVVLSEEKKRHTSTALKKAFHEINKLCRANESHDYCVQGIPTPVTPQPNVPVAVLLNENAQNMLDNNRSHLSVHDGRTRNSMTVESLRRME